MAGLGEQGVSSRCGLDTVHNIENLYLNIFSHQIYHYEKNTCNDIVRELLN